MPRLHFDPTRHGFQFKNDFTNTIVDVVGHRLTTQGLCGGMSLAAFNYYRHGYPVPVHRPEDFGTGDGVPPEGGRLRDYIYGQQLGSFASAAGFVFFTWPGQSEDEILRAQYQASLGDFDRIRRAIDRGVFVLLGLRSSRIGNLIGHQVLAYGYEDGPPRVYIYDSNFPNQEMMVKADAGSERIVHTDARGNPSPCAGDYGSFFVQLELDPGTTDVFTEASRPSYRDLALRQGLWVSDPAGDGLRQAGEPLEFDAVVCNFGDHRAHVRDLVIWARDPAGRNRDGDFGVQVGSLSLERGQEVRLNRRFDRFGEEPGLYRFGVSYLSEQGHWIDVPPVANGTQSQRSVELVTGVDAGTEYGSGGYRGPGTYFICARHSGKVFDVNIDWFSGQNNGRPVCQVDRNDGDHQRFIVEPLPEGYVRIKAKHSGKCLDVEHASTAPGAGLQQWDCLGGPNQQFAIEPIGDHYRIRARHTGMYLDVAGARLDNGARLTQWHWWGGNNQLFQFVPTA